MPRSIATNPNSQACLSCRSKHLKCDAKQPTCDRCAINNLICIYVRSKRGYVGGRGRRTQNHPESFESTSAHQSDARVPGFDFTPSAFSEKLSGHLTPSSSQTIEIEAQTSSDVHDDRLIHLYYRYIHPAHPFLIPHKLLKQDPGIIPPCLRSAMFFIAKPFHESRLWDPYEFQGIFEACARPDAFQVQALLLLTIAAYAHGERVQGDRAIWQAKTTADQIGLHSDDFDAGNSPMLRESWRRTWWELYSVCGMLRVLTTTTPKIRTPGNRPTPCHDVAYESCRPTESTNLSQMQDRYFVQNKFQYSSFAYRIEAVRILNEVLDFTNHDSQELQSSSDFNAHRAAIRSYLLTFPISSHDITDAIGPSDELLFCAFTTINLASIVLNLPRSSLPTAHSFNTICQTKRAIVFPFDNNCTVAAIGAADTIVELLMNRSIESMQSISPCFSCMLAFAATVHLWAYGLNRDQKRIGTLREHVQVSLAALNAAGQTWPIARIVKGQLGEAAREVFAKTAKFPPESLSRQNNIDPAQLPGPVLSDLDDQWLHDLVNTELDFDTLL